MKYPTTLCICWAISISCFHLGGGTLIQIFGCLGVWACLTWWLVINRKRIWDKYPLSANANRKP